MFLASLFLSFGSTLFAIDYLENDFRDINNTTHIRGILNPKSDNLALNVFEYEWVVMPQHKKNNTAFGTLYFDMYYNFNSFKLGVFEERTSSIEANSGFIQTWYKSSKDFNIFLHKNDIGQEIDYTDISGDVNYYDTRGVYLQKVFSLNQYNFLSVKLKFYYANDIQNITLDGYNTKDRFQASFDYYYSDKNYISNNDDHDKNYNGYGYGFDVEYIYNKDKLYIYAGLLNIGGHINWKGISKMHYDFDSETIYLGEDGYNHKRPFGVGKYSYNINYNQELPLFYRGSFDYKVTNNISIGNNLNGYNSVVFNEVYLNTKIYHGRYKVGYIYEIKSFIFGAYFKYFKVEISNNFGLSNKVMQAKLHLYF